MLYDYKQNKFTDLQKSFRKNIGFDIDAGSWGNIIKLQATISVCNKFREMQFKIIHQACHHIHVTNLTNRFHLNV